MTAQQLQLSLALSVLWGSCWIALIHVCSNAIRASVGGDEEKLTALWLRYKLGFFVLPIWRTLFPKGSRDEMSEEFQRLQSKAQLLAVLTLLSLAIVVIHSVKSPPPPEGGWEHWGVIWFVIIGIVACVFEFEVIRGLRAIRHTPRGKKEFMLAVGFCLFVLGIGLPACLYDLWRSYGPYLNPFK